MNKFTAAFVAIFGLTTALLADDSNPTAHTLPPSSTKTGVTYATDIKPIFDAHCIKCHGIKKPGRGIVLTSLESALKGGKDGKIIAIGDSAKSDLVLAVSHVGDPMTFMPKHAKQLSPEQIGLIRAWIDQGAK